MSHDLSNPGKGVSALREMQHVRSLEVPVLADPPELHQISYLLGRKFDAVRVGRQGLADLGRGPDVELPLLALRVGIQRRAEAALGTLHLAERPVERLPADTAEPLLA